MKIANVNKSLEFLSKIEKVNSRHLYSGDKIVRCDKKIIWELLYDIWSYYKNRTVGNVAKSPCFQPRLQGVKTNSTSEIDSKTKLTREEETDSFLETNQRKNNKNLINKKVVSSNFNDDILLNKDNSDLTNNIDLSIHNKR